jgi:hypothetical protein
LVSYKGRNNYGYLKKGYVFTPKGDEVREDWRNGTIRSLLICAIRYKFWDDLHPYDESGKIYCTQRRNK